MVIVARRTLLIALTLFGLGAACASAPPPPKPKSKPLFVDGVRQKPVDTQEVELAANREASRLAACYRRERLNLQAQKPASFLFAIHVGTAGEPVRVELLEMEPQGQPILEECVTEVLAGLRFPPHVGAPLEVRIPIQPLDVF